MIGKYVIWEMKLVTDKHYCSVMHVLHALSSRNTDMLCFFFSFVMCEQNES